MMNRRLFSLTFALAGLIACGGSSSSATASNNFGSTLSGANEVPAVTTAGAGTATFTLSGSTVTYTVNYTGLSGSPTASHLHVGASGVAGSVVVPFSGLPTTSSGTFTGTFTQANIKPQTNPVVNTLDDLVAVLRAGNAYVNIHTTANPGGEIRGQMAAQ